MTPDELRALLARLHLSQVAGARFVGVEPRTMRRWCAGVQPVGETAGRLLTVADQVPAAHKVLQRLQASDQAPEALREASRGAD